MLFEKHFFEKNLHKNFFLSVIAFQMSITPSAVVNNLSSGAHWVPSQLRGDLTLPEADIALRCRQTN